MKPERLILPRQHWETMRAHIIAQLPLEACGMLAGTSNQVRETLIVVNAAQSPVRFRMDAQEQWQALVQIDDWGLEMLAIFHSHPNGPAIPSPTDVAEAAYPVVNIIWSPMAGDWHARGFWIEAGQVSEVPLDVVE